MIPRTVQMAKEVASQLSSVEVENFGNIILNGYPTTATGKTGWPYVINPVLKGWTTNYSEYYTNQQPNGYGVNPGDPTSFSYSVHSWTQQTGPIKTLGGGNGAWISTGSGYNVGTYTGVSLTGGTGSGATATIEVSNIDTGEGPITGYTQTSGGTGYPAGSSMVGMDTVAVTGRGSGATVNGTGGFSAPYPLTIFALSSPGVNYRVGDILEVPGGTTPARMTVDSVGVGGTVTTVTLVNPGTGYTPGDTLTAALPGGGSGFAAPVGEVDGVPGTGNVQKWAQTPVRVTQNQVLPTSSNPSINNPAAIQYSFMTPLESDNLKNPPIGDLAPDPPAGGGGGGGGTGGGIVAPGFGGGFTTK